ncbi:MAG: hypothetical protein ABRQ27_00480 [Clostridiaceae bacterium]
MAQGKLYRNFIILQEDEKGHSMSEDKPVSGYAKIETRDENCKISFYVQNIKKDGNRHYMVLISDKKENKQIINLGAVDITDIGKVEASVECLSDNIGGLGLSYDKISGAAVYKEADGKNIFIITGFMSGSEPKDNWKEYSICKFQEKRERGGDRRVKEEPSIKERPSEEKIVIEEKASSKEEIVQEPVLEMNEQNHFDKYEASLQERESDSRNDSGGVVSEFFESLAEDFEVDRDKNEKKDIKHTKWYKVHINNLDDMTDMKDYNKYTIIYYPMINYYPYFKKHGHYCIGYKYNSRGKLKYIIYGVPGKRGKEDQPFGGKTGFVTWMEDSSIGDDLGYWLMFYDFRNSVIVIPMES